MTARLKVLLENRRLIVQIGPWSVIDLDVMTRLPPPKPPKAAAAVSEIPGYDPHGTTAAQVEQADEPAPGFGLGFGMSTVVAKQGASRPLRIIRPGQPPE